MSSLRIAVADGIVISWRNLKRVPRIPELAIFAILQSIMFVLLFAFVFGGAIPIPGGGSYTEFLMPGIFVQTLAFASVTTAIAVADDMTKGLIDRFRSLPMARSAVLSGRTFADIVYNVGLLIVLMLTGLVVGWRVHSSFAEFMYGVLLLLFFTYAMAWIGVYLGLSVPTVEVAQQLGFLVIFPITFLSNAFVPIETLACAVAADRRVEPRQRAHRGNTRALRQPQSVRVGFVPRRASDLHVRGLDDRADRRLHATRDSQVPRDRPLTAASSNGGKHFVGGWEAAGRWMGQLLACSMIARHVIRALVSRGGACR